jgi:hypothetical protein
MTNLRKAAESSSDPTSVINEGIADLNTHRDNYTVDGPDAKRLKLLWWEFPKEHWKPLREGSHMHFLRAPAPMIHDNAEMDKEQTQVAAKCVHELLDLGAVQTPAEGRIICTTAPLFVVPRKGKNANGG